MEKIPENLNLSSWFHYKHLNKYLRISSTKLSAYWIQNCTHIFNLYLGIMTWILTQEGATQPT